MKRKKRRTLGKKINTKDWLVLKPYNTFTLYDRYYVNCAINVLNLLEASPDFFYHFGLKKDDLKQMACILASYFEDFINEIGIWNVFQQKNQALYGYPLPFYDLKDYHIDYINAADFSYLIWHYFGKKTGSIFAPDEPLILALGQSIYHLLEEKIDDAPTTDFYDIYLKIEDDINFFDLKERLTWFSFHSYTLGIEFRDDHFKQVEEYILQGKNSQVQIPPNQYSYAILNDYIYKYNSSFSGLSVREWFAATTKSNPEIKKAINGLHQIIMSQFFYEKETDSHWYMRELHTDRIFILPKESVKFTKNAREKGFLQAMTIVKWKDEWWMTGMTMGLGKIPVSKIKELKRDVANTPFYAYDDETQQRLRDDTDIMNQYFIECFNTAFVLAEKRSEVNKVLQTQSDYYNNNRPHGKENEEVLKADFLKKNKATKEKWNWNKLKVDNPKQVAVVCVPNIGCIIDFNLAKAISLMEQSEITEEEADHLFDTILQDTHPYAARYLLNNYPTHNLRYPIPSANVDVLKEAEFLMRYFNPKHFEVNVPNLKLTDDSPFPED